MTSNKPTLGLLDLTRSSPKRSTKHLLADGMSRLPTVRRCRPHPSCLPTRVSQHPRHGWDWRPLGQRGPRADFPGDRPVLADRKGAAWAVRLCQGTCPTEPGTCARMHRQGDEKNRPGPPGSTVPRGFLGNPCMRVPGHVVQDPSLAPGPCPHCPGVGNRAVGRAGGSAQGLGQSLARGTLPLSCRGHEAGPMAQESREEGRCPGEGQRAPRGGG